MKKLIYALVVLLVVAGGLVFANRETKNGTPKKSSSRMPTAAERLAAKKNWEASPDGIKYKKWEASSAGKKVLASAAKIRKYIKGYKDMETVVTSLSLPPGSRLGFGVMVKIENEDYILAFGAEDPKTKNEFKLLHGLKVNDRIIVRSHNISLAPKYAYIIISGDYVQQGGKVIYKRIPRKGGC